MSKHKQHDRAVTGLVRFKHSIYSRTMHIIKLKIFAISRVPGMEPLHSRRGAVPYPNKLFLEIALDCISVRLECHLRFNERAVSAATSTANDLNTAARCRENDCWGSNKNSERTAGFPSLQESLHVIFQVQSGLWRAFQ
jgi:hypothetical protein